MDKKNEAAEIIAELNEKHRDVLQPLVDRVNELSIAGDGDGIFFLHESLKVLTDAIVDLLRSRPIVSESQVARAGADIRKKLN